MLEYLQKDKPNASTTAAKAKKKKGQLGDDEELIVELDFGGC